MCNLKHKALTLLKMRQPVPMSVAVESRVCERMAKKGMKECGTRKGKKTSQKRKPTEENLKEEEKEEKRKDK